LPIRSISRRQSATKICNFQLHQLLAIEDGTFE
jgi:hypothetical protein